MKYALINEHTSQFSITLMCKALGVSRSGFYKWKAKPVSKRLEKKKLVDQEVLDTYSTFKARYGDGFVFTEDSGLGFRYNDDRRTYHNRADHGF